jgi:hypothetical protein
MGSSTGLEDGVPCAKPSRWESDCRPTWVPSGVHRGSTASKKPLMLTEPHSFGPNLTADRARSFSDSISRLRGPAVVTNDRISAVADAVTSSTARSNATPFDLDGLVNPQSFLTNWSDASRISASVAGGSKLKSVLMFLHMAALVSPVGQGFVGNSNGFQVDGMSLREVLCCVRNNFPARFEMTKVVHAVNNLQVQRLLSLEPVEQWRWAHKRAGVGVESRHDRGKCCDRCIRV